MTTRQFVCGFLTTLIACVFVSTANGQDAKPAATRASDSTLRVQSIRLGRATAELQRQFPNRYHGDTNPGVAMVLLLTMKEPVIAPSRDAIVVEQFLDDTYQSLLTTGREYGYSGNPPQVSEDGKTVLFTVTANRPPAEDAERVFVRGSLSARMMRGEMKVASAELKLTAGEKAEVGPFKTTVRSIADSGATGPNVRNNVTLTLAVEGDGARIRKVRALSKEGRPINDDANDRFRERIQNENQITTMYLNLGAPPQPESLTLEFTYADKLENVKIPFEVQVDIGQTKAGPPQAGDAKPPARGDGGKLRPWPPPPPQADANSALPPRRIAWNPTTRGAAEVAAKTKLEKVAVDLFSLTVGKPAPGEAEGVQWANPPSPWLRASGFTLARLMLSTPDATILSIPPEGVNITKFEDDKVGKRDTTLYREERAGYGFGRSWATADGQQALVTVSMASAPAPGATRCTLAGTVKARIARNDRAETSKSIPTAPNSALTVGPFQGQILYVRQQPPLTPNAGSGSIELWMTLNGPVGKLRTFELLDGATQHPIMRRDFNVENEDPNRVNSTNTSFGVQVGATPPEQVIVRLRHYDRTEEVEIPFEVSTGIGL